jgi:hypothetical protein
MIKVTLFGEQEAGTFDEGTWETTIPGNFDRLVNSDYVRAEQESGYIPDDDEFAFNRIKNQFDDTAKLVSKTKPRKLSPRVDY